MITFDDGLIKTCLLPVLSALLIALRASARTEDLVILVDDSCKKINRNISSLITYSSLWQWRTTCSEKVLPCSGTRSALRERERESTPGESLTLTLFFVCGARGSNCRGRCLCAAKISWLLTLSYLAGYSSQLHVTVWTLLLNHKTV